MARSWTSDSTCILKAVPVKLDIKRHEPATLFISLHGPLYINREFDVNIDFRVIDDVFKILGH